MKRIFILTLCCVLILTAVGCQLSPNSDPNKTIDSTAAKQFAETCFDSYMKNEGIEDYTIIVDSISFKEDNQNFFIATFSAEYLQDSAEKYVLNYSYYIECKSENHFEILDEGTELKQSIQ